MRATTDATDAVHNSDVSLVCVGTPGQANGSLDLSYVKGACKQIALAFQMYQQDYDGSYTWQGPRMGDDNADFMAPGAKPTP